FYGSKSPFRPSAPYFDGTKAGKAQLRFRPDFVGFLRPDTDQGLSRHLRRTLLRQYHLDKKALSFIYSG
ncbi:hypothetical protein EGV01_07020, partial [Pseudomonas syringae pv. theae]|nr:hypothetical protein [Pseudomonas syringae pv. theae]